MKFATLALLFLTLSGCASGGASRQTNAPPLLPKYTLDKTPSADVLCSQIIVKYDKFKNSSIAATPIFLSDPSGVGPDCSTCESSVAEIFPGGKLSRISVVTTVNNLNWSFLDSAKDSSGHDRDFSKLSSDVENNGLHESVTCQERFSIKIEQSELDALSKSGFEFKAYGSKGTAVISIPPQYFGAAKLFLDRHPDGIAAQP